MEPTASWVAWRCKRRLRGRARLSRLVRGRPKRRGRRARQEVSTVAVGGKGRIIACNLAGSTKKLRMGERADRTLYLSSERVLAALRQVLVDTGQGVRDVPEAVHELFLRNSERMGENDRGTRNDW